MALPLGTGNANKNVMYFWGERWNQEVENSRFTVAVRSGVRGQNIRGKGSKGAGSKGPGSKGQGLGVKVKVKIIVSAHMKILVHVQVSGKGQSGVKVIIRVKVTGQSNRALSVADPESSILVWER